MMIITTFTIIFVKSVDKKCKEWYNKDEVKERK